jgi:hypothetical protein
MRMKEIIFLCITCLLSVSMYAQTNASSFEQPGNPDEIEIKRTVDIGFGFGLDYGGIIGAKVAFVPIKHLSIFASGGYHMVAFGWQVGIIGYILPKINLKKIRPYVKVMYGSNRVIVVEDASQYDKNYIGFTPGAGVEMRFGATRSNGINIDLNFPINSSEFNEDYNDLDNNPYIEMSSPLPIAFSIGYHFEF